MTASPHPLGSPYRPRATLANAALPPRVRGVLERLHAAAAGPVARQLDLALDEYERRLLRQADQARRPEQRQGLLETLRATRRHRADLAPRCLAELESALAAIREPAPARGPTARPSFHELRLVEHDEVEEDSLQRTIAVRHERRAALPLLLLGQRFGVLAGAPAFDPERLPLGPYRLVRMLGEAMQALPTGREARLQLYRAYDETALAEYPAWLETLNELLAREGVLPGLAYVPLRPRPRPQAAGEARAAPGRPPDAREPAAPAEGRPLTGWLGLDEEERADAFAPLRQLLARRRQALQRLRAPQQPERPALPTGEALDALAALQRSRAPDAPAPELADLRRHLLALARQRYGAEAGLAGDDQDALDLLELFLARIERELRPGAAAGELIARLRLPLLRAALQDRTLFVRNGHPARQLLEAVAEAGARWLPWEELDPHLDEQLRHAVEQVLRQPDDTAAAFQAARDELHEHLRLVARKAELAERRHVEAARGKERLADAKRRAAGALAGMLGERPLPRFVHGLLQQAWLDVLTLTLLRHGEDSPAWREQLQATERIVAAHAQPPSPAPAQLEVAVEHALTLVGHHGEDAGAIARQLLGLGGDEASRTQLALRLKSRARLGEDAPAASAPAPRDAETERCWRRLRALPPGTWFEFDGDAPGEVLRRRLSWHSAVTQQALFVNARGQRVCELGLDELARSMAAGRARVVEAREGRLLDRAWRATLAALDPGRHDAEENA
ncbi:uncharacterized protein DUF1631 [Vulcaniibacterium tengchongense]|uniref:Uncharacterized protein DUF1631 n=3 Tax=Vulcaniibacterium tengchongense TaxID=1273429 RepID=A0A3N4UXY2_9GAMM|nr:DUF1631 family protein [Vulcaniibacterium tengchongense]RPE74853.1 uncharacterized protein DUF1631 [Vulcaniibacterium tengchongense]